MGIRDFVRDISPPWLIGPGTPNTVLPASAGIAERFLYSLAFGMDALAQKVDDAIEMRFPGRGDPSALPVIGDDRQITRGIGESNADYAERLQYWLTTWRWAGTARGVLANVYAYVGARPRTQVVLDGDGQSVWNFINGGASAFATPTTSHRVPKNWTWDNETFVKRRWLIIDGVGDYTWATAGNIWGDPGLVWGTSRSIGFLESPAIFSTIKSIVRQWQSADARYQWLIVNYVGTWYPYNAPAGSPLLPDATWEHWSKIDTTTTPARPCRVEARFGGSFFVAIDTPW